MPRFFFNIRHGQNIQPDLEGTELDSLHRARIEAITTLSEIAREEFPLDGDHQDLAIELLDEQGGRLLTASISFNVDRAALLDRNPPAREDEDR
jgi:hypothetical protein